MTSHSHTSANTPSVRVDTQGFTGLGTVCYNRSELELYDAAIKRGEGVRGKGDVLLVNTGAHTGRSAKDKYIVRNSSVEGDIWWDNNTPMSPECFDVLYQDVCTHMQGRTYDVQDLYAGADLKCQRNIRVMTELAWHGLFIRHLLRRPDGQELQTFQPEFTIVNCPSFFASPERHGCRSETVIALNFEKKIVLICGTKYAGENKKAVFTLLNYLLPEQGVFPMHCSANHGVEDPEDVAVFFGLSGTGKTTLSADPTRVLIGDDEHGWSQDGVFNIEGGCYAKTIGLNPEAEPAIYATCSMAQTVIENMVFDPQTFELEFNNDEITANMRCAYPLSYIPNASQSSKAGQPKNIVMLTCDAFGVLPPLSKLSAEQAMYHFLSGFTSKVAGTEKGVTEPEPTFSTCFGAPFMPRRPEVYGQMLQDKISSTQAQCWLVNTGWSGGGYGTGQRMPIAVTRALLCAVLEGRFEGMDFRVDPNFEFEVPTSFPSTNGVDASWVESFLNPRMTWQDQDAYERVALRLVGMFQKNFEQYLPFVPEEMKSFALCA